MGKHLKRITGPRSWKIERKTKKWIVKPQAGPHKEEESMPLLLIVRDYLGFANTSNEAKKIINGNKILVNKVARTSIKFPVGLMDVIEFPDANERWIILLDNKGRFTLKKLTKKNAKYKLCKILDKTLVRGGNVQLNLHDGGNILIKIKDQSKRDEDVYKVHDTIVLDTEKKVTANHIPFKEGNLALIIGGAHISEIAKIEEIKKLRSPEPNIVTLSADGNKFQTIEDYVFVIGEKEPFISEVAK